MEDKIIEEIKKRLRPEMNEDDIVELAEEMSDKFPELTKPEDRKVVFKKIYDNFMNELTKIDEEVDVVIYQKEIDAVDAIDGELPKMLFLALLIMSKKRWHKSGWIRFDLKEIQKMIGLPVDQGEFAALIGNGFEMRAYGREKPLLTFKSLEWVIHGDLQFDDEVFVHLSTRDAQTFIHNYVEASTAPKED